MKENIFNSRYNFQNGDIHSSILDIFPYGGTFISKSGEQVVFGSGGGSRWNWFCGGKKVGELCGFFYVAQVSLQLM